MATYNKYQHFVEAVGLKLHDLNTDTIKIALTNTTPNAGTHEGLADITEISAGNGYSAGGNVVANNSYSQTGGTATFDGDTIVFTASGGSIATFRYAVLYNDTSTGDKLIAYYDSGSAQDITDGNTFTVTVTTTLFTLT